MAKDNKKGVLFEGFNSVNKTEALMAEYTYLKGDESVNEKRKKTIYNWHLSKGMSFTDVNEFPIVKAYNGVIPNSLVGFSEISHQQYDCGLHFFQHDYTFSRIWPRLDYYTVIVSKFKCVIAPDYSLFVDTSKQLNFESLYKNRFVTARWQNCGINVIPSASWGNADSFEYCFEGLPTNSVIAIGAVGVSRNADTLALWRYGVSQVIEKLHPTALLIYGSQIEFEKQGVPVYYHKDFINLNFRNNGQSKKIN